MFDLVVISLAAWYCAHVVTLESGPLNVFGRLRVWANRSGAPKGSFAEAITCIYCMAFWASALLYAIYALTPAQPLVYVLAVAGGALVADRWISS
jgi:hypothetical protein